MPFDYVKMLNDLYPPPKPGDWVNAAASLPKEFDEIVFLVDDGSVDGVAYFGHREGDEFKSMIGAEVLSFPVGGESGVAFWSLAPDHKDAFVDSPRKGKAVRMTQADRETVKWAALLLSNFAEERGDSSDRYSQRLQAAADTLRRLAGISSHKP